MIAAMKAKDKFRKDAISALVSAVKKKGIDNGCRDNIPDEMANEAILKEIKSVKEQIDTCPADRTELLEEYKKRYEIMSEFAPKMLSAEEVKAILEEKFSDVLATKNKGQIMKAVMGELKGKAVIVDFTVYQSAVSATHNYMLRDLYDKYAAQGLEIYQVSLDADEHYWKTTADNLPWICVRDGNGIYSSIAASYNVKNVPSVFLVNKNNELSARGESVKDLEAAVKALL